MAFERVRRVFQAKSLTTFWHARSADILALGGIALFFVVFFSWTLFTDRQILSGDALYYNYPLRTIAWRMIRAGDLPLWTPHVFSGYPLLSMAQLGLAYPLTWGYLFLPGHIAEKIYVLAPFLLAPTFTYLYLRKIKRSPLASLLGALTFGYGGMMASPLANNGLIPNAAMWLPLLLIAIEGARHSPIVRPILLATFAYTMSVLTGTGQGFVYIGILAFLYALFLVISTSRSPHQLYSLSQWRPIFVIAFAGIAALGVAAFQILESWQAAQESVRSTLTYELFTQGSYKFEHLWKSVHTPIFYVIDMPAYVPPLAAGLACFAFITHFRARLKERDTRVFFWSAAAVFAWILMMGAYTRVYQIVYYIPIVNLFRVPTRHTIEWTFAVGVLAAYGWDALSPVARRWRDKISRSNATTIYASLLLLVVAIVVGSQWWIRAQTLQKDAPGWPHSPTVYHLWKAAFVFLLLAALWRAALSRSQRWRPIVLGVVVLTTCFVEPSLLVHRWWPPIPKSSFTNSTEITEYLRQFPAANNRVYTRAHLMSEHGEVAPRFHAPNLSGMWGHHEVAGYEPAIFQRYSRALGGAWLDGVHTGDRGIADPTLVSERSHVLDLLNTTFLISYPNLATSLPEVAVSSTKASDFWKVVYENRGVQVWQNSRAMARAWLVAEAESVSGETALSRIRGETAEAFDPNRTALLEVPQAELPQLPGGPLAPGSSATVSRYEPNHLTIDTTASTNTLLVVSEVFFPGWQVTVDGQPGRILVTDYLLRGVPLTAGQHRVEMYYSAPAARTGAIISLITLGLIVGLAIRSRHSLFRPAETEVSEEVVETVSASDSVIAKWIAIIPRWASSLPRFWREVLTFVGFLMLTGVMTWPWVLHLRDAIADNGDSYAFVWSLWWNYHQTINDPLNLFHANIFFPFRYTLAFTEHGYGVALLFFPLLALGFRPLTVYSVATLSAFAFCGYASFRLARTLTGSFVVALVAGIIFAFIPYRFLSLTALPYLFCGWLPLSLEALILFARRRSRRRAAWLGLCLLMSGTTNVTWFFYSLVPLAISVVFLVIRYGLEKDRDFWVRGLSATVISLLLLFPFLWPYYKASTLYSFRKDAVEVTDNSVRTVEWLTAPRYNKFWGEMGSGLQGARVTLFTGLLPLLLFLAGILLIDGQARVTRNNDQLQTNTSKKYWHLLPKLDFLCLVAFVLAILAAGYSGAPDLSQFEGRFLNSQTSDRSLFVLVVLLFVRFCISYPAVLRFGRNRNLVETLRSERRSDAFWIGTIWTFVGVFLAFGMKLFFYRVLYDLVLPFQSLRAPHRAAMIAYVGFALLAGLGAKRVVNRIVRQRPLDAWKPFLVIAIILLFELNAAPLPFIHGAVDPDAVTVKLKQTTMRGGVVDLPSLPQPPYYSWHLSMLRSADHGHPVIFAASSFTPPLTMQVHQLASAPNLTPELLTLLEQIPTSYIVLHRKLIEPAREPEFTKFFNDGVSTGRLRFIGTFGEGDDLYSVVKTEPESR